MNIQCNRKIVLGFIFASMLTINGCGSSSPSSNTKTATVKEVLTAGMFEFKKVGAFNTTTFNFDSYYSMVRTTLDGGGANIVALTSYYDRSAKSWTNTAPAGFPTSPAAYFLSSNGTWSLIDNSNPPQLVAFNPDGTATFSMFGQTIIESVTAVDISGQTASSSNSDIPPLLTSKNIFPTGSIRYDLSGTLVSSSYVVIDVFDSSLTTLTQIPTLYADSSSNAVGISSSITTSDFLLRFVTGSNEVNIYQETYSSPSTTTKVGTGTYATTTVSGQQILEVSIPQAIRSQYSLGSNPAFAVVNGKVMAGSNLGTGTAATNSIKTNVYNDIAANHITANIDTAIAKPVIK